MRIVNVKDIKSVSTIYSHIPQPMYIYHSWEEFTNNVSPVDENEQKVIQIIGMGDYYEFLHNNNINTDYDPDNVYVDLRKYNVWIKTVDKFIPDYADAQGNIFYKPGANGNPIPTDGVYIRLYFLTPTPSRHVLYTSSGLHTVGMSKWDMTGAQRVSFIQEKVPATKGEAYQIRLKKFLKTKRPTVRFMKLAMALMVSDSDSFLDVDKAVNAAFGSSVKAADRLKILESPAFRSSLMTTLKTLYPTLAPEIRKGHSPKEMAEKLTVLWDKAVNSGDIEKMIKVFDKITEVGYEENTSVTDDRVPQVRLISDKSEEADGIKLPDYNKLSEKTIEKTAELTDEELDLRRKEQDYPDSYVMPEQEENEKAETEV